MEMSGTEALHATDATPFPGSRIRTNGHDIGRAAGLVAERLLPDVTEESAADVPGPLDHVGMSNVELVLRRRDAAGEIVQTPARGEVFVDLVDPTAKGIHMSRLYLLLQDGCDGGELAPELHARILHDCVDSHRGTSTSSRIAVAFDHVLRRPALVSELAGWRSYPVRIASDLVDGTVRHEVTVEIAYSSTCPCSAALARQLLQDGFERDFAGRAAVPVDELHRWLGTREAMTALPHAQRSHATVTVVLDERADDFGIDTLIDLAEQAVGTPVQAVVKRADEQEFARLNGENLMFCEDAARRIRAAVEPLPDVRDFRIEVRHLESLHPHDAVAVVAKGVPGGLRA
jgi:GTP cyclohydrolase IB